MLDEMFTLFGERESRLNIRRKFESRKWFFVEDYSSQFNNKVLLADRLGVPEDELIDYIIDGIMDDSLKTHANLRCFQEKSQLLMSFSKIQLKETSGNKRVKQGVGVRCYNCICVGHHASEWQKLCGSCLPGSEGWW